MRRIGSGDALRAERQQHFSIGGEFHDGVASAASAAAIRDPDIAFLIDRDAMRESEHAAAEGTHEFPLLVEFDDGIEIGAHAGIGAAAVERPNAFAVDVDGDGGGRAPIAPHRHLREIGDGPVRVGKIVRRLIILRERRAKKRERGYSREQCRMASFEHDCPP
jgi:hypothetical protein